MHTIEPKGRTHLSFQEEKVIFLLRKGYLNAHVKVKVAQSCPTLCDPMDITVHGILQARILEWVAFLFSRGSSQPEEKPRNTGVGSLSLL